MTDVHLQLNQAAQQLQAGDPGGCHDLCQMLLNAHPDLLPAKHLRGLASANLGHQENAINDLTHVWSQQASNLQAALALGTLLRQAERFEEALDPLQAAARQSELEVDARYELARCLTRLRHAEKAMAEYRAVLTRMPAHTDAAANLSMLLERANQLDEAGHWADQALAGSASNLVAGLTRATLDRRAGKTTEAIARLESLLNQGLSPLNKSIVLNQLGQCHDLAEQWDSAWARFQQSNETLRAHHPHGTPLDNGSYGLETIKQIQIWIKSQPPSRWSGFELETSDEPVFLVGFPRSGTTLLDQALSAHPDIEVLEELELLDPVRRKWVDRDGLLNLSQMNTEDIHSSREMYLAERQSHRTDLNKPLVIDKLPLNLVYLFLIYRLFPRSHILFVLRDPRDACLSCYFQAFDLQGAMPYFLDFADTTNYYGSAMSLATGTMNSIANPRLTLRYENLVTNFESTMRGAIAFLGLEWDSGVLNYREKSKKSTIATPSYQQVVQPLYKRSVGRWRHYRDHMEPGLANLSQWVDYFDYRAG